MVSKSEIAEKVIMWTMFAMVVWANILVTIIFFGHYVFRIM